jgi:DNA-binding transcriptional regulator YiaG
VKRKPNEAEPEDSHRPGEVCLRLQEFDVRRYREELGLSQSAFSRQMEVPIDTLKKWEGGKVEPTFGGRFRAVLDGWLQRELRRVLASRT